MNLFRLKLFTTGLLLAGILQAFASPKPKPGQPPHFLLSIPISEKVNPARLIEVKAGEPALTLTSNGTLTISEADLVTTNTELTPPPPSVDIYVWSGAVSKQWQDPANWLVNNAVATGIPTFGSTIGNVVQIPVVASGNYPEITTSAGARSITIAATASLTIKSGGKIHISGSADNSVVNSGTFTNNGTVELDSTLTDGFINQAGAALVNTNTATFTIGLGFGSAGLGNSLKNSGSITNTGTFTIKAGAKTGFINYIGGVLTNTSNFNLQSGNKGGIYNQGKIDNSGQMQVQSGQTETQFDNLDTLINRVGATLIISSHEDRLLDNRKYILNEGTITVQQGGKYGGVLNRTSAKLLNKATGTFVIQYTTKTGLTNAGYVENANIFKSEYNGDTLVFNKATGEIVNTGNWSAKYGQNAICNLGQFTHGSTGTLTVQGNGTFSLKNAGTFLTATGCVLNISAVGTSIQNEANAIFTNNCTTTFEYHGSASVVNKGRYTHLNGSVSSQSMGAFIKNEKYLHLNVPITTLSATGKIFENSDTLIIGSQTSRAITAAGDFIINSGYLYSDAKFTFQYSGGIITNNAGGKMILSSQSSLKGKNVGGGQNVIFNAGHLTNEGVLEFSYAGPYIVNNTGTFLNKNRLKTGYSSNSVYNNGGIFENSGTIEVDTVGSAGIMQVGAGSSFTNTATGKITVDMSSTGGISNAAGTFINNGELLLAQTDSLRNSAINNAAIFQNNNLIRIGRAGDNGIINTGTFTNGVSSSIFITTKTKTLAITPAKGIDNQGGTFTNQHCATIESTTKIINSSGSFTNAGTIKKTEDNVTGDSNISSNSGTIINQDANAFTVTGSNTLFTVNITNSASPLCQGNPRLLTASPAGGTFSVTGPGTVVGDMLTATGSGSVNVTYTYSPGPNCSFTATQTIPIFSAPIVTLTVNGQTFNTGNNQVLCDTDTNPNNALSFNVTTACLAGPVQWRTQIGAGAWSDWSTTAPSSQPTNNTVYRYQAACGDNCPSAYTNPIEVTINYRAAVPQNVSLTADGTTVVAGQSATVCNAEGNTITFNATCGAGEILLYSVDGGDYSSVMPSQITDGNFHNYRVRCRKADNTPSCVESESASMSLKITTPSGAPTVSISPTNGCGTPVAFSGSASCGALVTVWYNAATNQALPTLPTMTPNATTSFYARCQNEAGCLSEISNIVTFTVVPVNSAPLVSASSEVVCTGSEVTLSAACPEGTNVQWNNNLTQNPLKVTFNSVTTQTYTARCITANGCQSPPSAAKTILWKAFELTFINVGQSKSAIKPANDRNLWTGQFITADAGPVLEKSTEGNPTIFYSENVNKTAPRYWTIQVETCALGTNGSLTYDLLATPELGIIRSYNTHENNAPYFMYANREGFTELYAQNHPLYGFFADNGSGGNVYDEGLPKGLYKLGIRYWDQKGQGSIYPSTRQPAGTVLAYQEYWFRIQSQNGIGTGSARVAADNGQRRMENGAFAQVMPNPTSNILHLKVNEAKGQKVNVTMTDAFGRALLQRTFVPETNQHQEEFEVTHLSNGIYFLQVNAADKQTTLKVVKVQ